MKNLKIFNVKYMGCTNTQGSRIKVTDALRGVSVTKAYNYATGNVLDQGVAMLESAGYEIKFTGEDKKGYIIGTNWDNGEYTIKDAK